MRWESQRRIWDNWLRGLWHKIISKTLWIIVQLGILKLMKRIILLLFSYHRLSKLVECVNFKKFNFLKDIWTVLFDSEIVAMAIILLLKHKMLLRHKLLLLQPLMCYKTRKQLLTWTLILTRVHNHQHCFELQMQLHLIWQRTCHQNKCKTIMRIWCKVFLNLGKLFIIGLLNLARRIFVQILATYLLSMNHKRMRLRLWMRCKGNFMMRGW